MDYSGLNYKDGMAICGIYGVVETLPLITGIDFVGIVDVTGMCVHWVHLDVHNGSAWLA